MEDPVVAEVRRVREQIMARFGYDLRRYTEYLREQEQRHPERVVTKAQLDERRGRTSGAATQTGAERRQEQADA
jgi:hypothetical protein